MTINGPAPVVLAFFMNAAIDQQIEKHLRENGHLEKAKKNATRTLQKTGCGASGVSYGTSEKSRWTGFGIVGIVR